MGDDYESAVLPVGRSLEVQLQRGCHDLLSQAAIVAMNLEFIGRRVDDEGKAAMEDVRLAMQRIVEIAQAISHVAETAAPTSGLANTG